MGCIISCLACQALSCCTGFACNCCGKMIPVTKSMATRIVYAAIFFLVSAIGYIFNGWAYKILHFVPELDLCKNDERWCVGALAVWRIFFSLSIFHLVCAILLICVRSSNDWRSGFQDGWWIPKILAIAGLAVVSFFIPNEFFVVWIWISLFGAALFILIQLVLLIDFAYLWADSWLSKYEKEENKFWFYALLICTIAMYAISFALSGVEFGLFYKGEECWMNIVFPIINILLFIFYSLLSLHPTIQASHTRGTGVLQSAVVAVYASYLVFSAATSEPTTDDFKCNPFDSASSSLSSVFLGAVFTIVAVCFSTIRTSTRGDDLLRPVNDSSEDERRVLKSQTPNPKGDEERGVETDDEGEFAQINPTDDETEQVAYNYSFFHITFMLGAMYVGMLITDWQLLSTSSHGGNFTVDHGFAAVWVKIASSWLVALLYVWTLVAPVIFPNREFA